MPYVDVMGASIGCVVSRVARKFARVARRVEGALIDAVRCDGARAGASIRDPPEQVRASVGHSHVPLAAWHALAVPSLRRARLPLRFVADGTCWVEDHPCGPAGPPRASA